MPLPAPDLPPLTQPYYGVQQYSTVPINPASHYSQPSVEINPGAGAPGPNSGWTSRLPRYLMGGYAGLGIGAINEVIRAIRGNRGNPASSMVGSGGRPTGIDPNTGRQYSAPSDTPPGMGGEGIPIPDTGPLFNYGSLPMNTRLSGPDYDAASRAQNAQTMAFQASGGYDTSPHTGNTQDAGHDIFGSQSRTHGLASDGVVEIQPGGVYDTVFAHGMGSSNPNAYHGPHGPQAPAQTALIEQQIRSQQPPSIGGNPSAPFVGPLPQQQPSMSRAAEFYRNLQLRHAQGGH